MESLEFSRAEGIFLKVCNTSITGSNPVDASSKSTEQSVLFSYRRSSVRYEIGFDRKPRRRTRYVKND